MFASRHEKDVEITDGGEVYVVTINMLSGTSLDKARIAEQIEQAAPIRAYGGDIIKALKSDALDAAAEALAASRATPEARQERRYKRYDREEVLVAGIKRWSCEDKVKLSRQAIVDLREGPAEQLKRAILDYSLPSLEEEEAAGKGASGASISS